jgi:bifunctional non-homologous end joining protein LigD
MDERSSPALKAYRDKRNFDITPEPAEGGVANEDERVFVIQKHWATRLHYDFRPELRPRRQAHGGARGRPSAVL